MPIIIRTTSQNSISTEGEIKDVILRFFEYFKQNNIEFLNIIRYPHDESIECYSSLDFGDHTDKLLEIFESSIISSSDNESNDMNDNNYFRLRDRTITEEQSSLLNTEQNEIIIINDRYEPATPDFTKTIPLNSQILVKKHIIDCFKEIKQVPCKSIAKQFIKIFEPSKQTSHPYKSRDASKPRWWPQSVPHIEPDHLKKSERLKLLGAMMEYCYQDVTILRNKEREASGNFTLGDLRKSVYGIEKKHLNEMKMKIIDEIFYVVEEMRNFSFQRDENHSFLNEVKQIKVSDFKNFNGSRRNTSSENTSNENQSIETSDSVTQSRTDEDILLQELYRYISLESS